MTGVLTTNDVVLSVEDLSTHLNGPDGPVRAVDGVSLDVAEGQTLGVVGESGSGKTVLGRSIAGLYEPGQVVYQQGQVNLDGVDLRELSPEEMRDVLGRRIAMVFQNPLSSLNPVMRIGEQISEQLRYKLQMDRANAADRAAELLTAVGMRDVDAQLRAYPHELSGGMRQRVMIAMAISCEPRLLIADEPTTALDVTVQRQILDLLQALQQHRRMATILVTHDLAVVADRADEVAVMYAGRLVERAPAPELFAEPLMPYTHALLAAIPSLEKPPHTRLQVIPGRPPDMVAPAVGCAFADRCPLVQRRCREEMPELTKKPGSRHWYRCWYPMSGKAN